ncbi:ABC transporter substrate-binding protein [Clostridium chauvoei]|uniref:Peptide ABC transporter substrate-binding protein n=2 Tax=Clostridium chauvoei TaxID=46867 RepID=A0ABD4RHQ6_9CLOT|nr:ABC transporter substrate-binding protein [Clostridium chauvoei]ATD55981.1 hypothetical protein BTM20_12520 [Clostridium chauvoei]ATD56349.1 hypothetical protein BTM21_00495 [Clostridium chauvoei]MBX7280879.1 peptide ABC transporter substrate-binding protein [Clostridium chauvoei]MBX7283362.1 peptide ABC transporter substrate-binding protein [Clostridium chauvoei]MBX7285955.1 peptide ABC transporter substrate-binding protein [Clostridium chauvoei]
MKKILITIVSSILLVVFLLGFVDIVKEKPTESKAVLTYSISTIPQDLKVIGKLDKREQDIVCATSRALVDLDKSGNILPSLAESVEVHDEGLEYDFKIRDDIYWSDGSQITPKDIASFFREILTEEDENSIEALLNVYGARDFRNGTGSFNENVGIRTTDTNLVIRLNTKDENFVKELSNPQYRLRKNVLLWQDIQNNYQELVYSGDYSISSMNISEVILKRNNKIDSKLVESIHIAKDEGEELAMAAFEVGNRDIVINPPKSQLDRLKSESKLVTLESTKGMYLAFNPNGESIPVEGKKDIYRLLNEAIGEYQIQNSSFVELAEGSYFRDDKDDLAKLQSRKVMSNEVDKWEHLKEVVLIAEETTENKNFSEFLSKWFEKNTDMILTYNLVPKEEFKNIHEETYYNIALLQCESSLSGENSLFNEMINFLPDNYKKELKNIQSEEERKNKFVSIEDSLFNTYQLLPVLFYNDNIAISDKIKNISLDRNGNIDFNKLEK